MAAYLTIRNDRDQSVTVTGMRSDQFQRVELHDTRVIDGVASMVKQNQFTIPAGGELTLKPGGKHIMLIGPKSPMEFGARIRGLVEFSNVEPVFISFSLRPVVERRTKTPLSPQDTDTGQRRDNPSELKGVEHKHMMEMSVDDMEPTPPVPDQPVDPTTPERPPLNNPVSGESDAQPASKTDTTTRRSNQSAEDELDDIINSIPAPLTRPGNNR
jgi:hypothetical protein